MVLDYICQYEIDFLLSTKCFDKLINQTHFYANFEVKQCTIEIFSEKLDAFLANDISISLPMV